LQSDVAPGKRDPSPVDADRLGIEQAFVALSEPLADGVMTIRIGRQENGFDLQRFLSCGMGRMFDKPMRGNCRLHARTWRFIALYTDPCKTGI